MKFSSRQALFQVLSKIVIVVVLFGCALWGWQKVRNEQIAMYQVQKRLNEFPEYIARQAALKTELERRQHDIDRLHTLTPTREGVNEVVSRLEEEARKDGVIVSIADIQEEQKTDESGQLLPLAGPLIEVSLKGVAHGDPKKLISFLFTMEHIPYLTRLTEWDLKIFTTGNTLPGNSATPFTSLATPVQIVTTPSQLSFTLFVAIQYE